MTPRGFSLIEVLIAVAVFSLLGLAIYSMGTAAVRGIRLYRESATIAALADKYMEVARNLPYSQIGTQNGNPSGPLPDLPNALIVPYNNASYQVYYVVTNISDPNDGVGVPQADYKQVKLYVQNVATARSVSFVTIITPQALETASGGALALEVFNAVGQPVPNATITITNTAITPHIQLTRTTNAQGLWTEVGLPSSANSYHITATASGYSSDQTYPNSVQNPNPTKPDATIVDSQVTQVSFSIDKTSSLTLNTVDQLCQPLAGVALKLQGAKLVGTPNVLKFDTTYTTDGSGKVVLNPLEWDNYTSAVTSPSYMLYGSSPIQPVNLLPNTTQQSTLILGPATPNSLLVVVTDAATGNPIEGANVELTNGGYDASKLTAGSILYQQDWSGGAGQSDFSAANEYFQDDGNVDTTTLPTGVHLAKVAGAYVSSGSLESSSFDTGTASTSYTTLTWNPTSQNPSTTAKFQLASNNDDSTWNFVGPDGTASSYYTVPGTTISSASNNARYVRYKVFLESTSTTTTPVLSNVTVNYVSGCFTPGQATFTGLSGGNYQVVVTMAGYQTQTITPQAVNGNTVLQVPLSQ